MSLGVEQRMLWMEEEGGRASLPLVWRTFPLACIIYSTCFGPHISWTVFGRALEKFTPLVFFFASHSPFWLTTPFFFRYVNILKQILVDWPGSYLLRWLCICFFVFYGSNSDGGLIGFILNFLGDTSYHYLTCHVCCAWVGKNGWRP